MSYIYLQEQGEESSAQNFSDIEQFVLLRLKNTQEKSCSSDSETESCLGSQSGTTSVHSMEHLGEESLILSPEDFLAKTFPQLERELESRANAQGFGDRWPGWWARYDQDSSSWKTPQCSLLGDLEEFSETWPNWGIMHDGAFWGLTTAVRHIEERESGSWRIPTPTCSDAFTSNLKSTQQKPDTMHSVSLAQLCEKMPEKMWPTPTSQEAGIINLKSKDGGPVKPGERAYNPNTGKHTQVTLNRAVNIWPTLGQKIGDIEAKEKSMWPTPNTLEGLKPKSLESIQEYNQKARPGRSYCNMNLREIVVYGKQPISGKTMYGTPTATMSERSEKFLRGAKSTPNPAEIARKESGKSGQLNPDWVEWLMGWPIGWTKIEPIEIDWRDWVVDPADTGEVPRVLQSIQNRVHRLKAIGNGQVPLVAATAWHILSDGLI